MPTATRTFRVFVSSTFEDLKDERNALQRDVFPKLEKLCLEKGARFQAIDLRWGVREEAGLDHRTIEICKAEIARCQKTGIKPNFIVLLGDRYGWRPLPAKIIETEFQKVRSRISDAGELADIDAWYNQVDENAEPPERLLKPREGIFESRDQWERIEQRLHRILREAAHQAELPAADLVKYDASATHQEILAGLQKPEDREHVFAFFRDPDAPKNPELKKLIETLQLELPKENVIPFAAGDIDALCDQVTKSLTKVMEAEASRFQSQTPLELEVASHKALAEERSKRFVGRRLVLDAIENYLKDDDRRPLVVYGPSGSGKSAILAKASVDHQGVRRFIGATPSSSNGLTLLRSLCEEIGERYDEAGPVPATFNEITVMFQDRLRLATPERPLILYIDALDQLTPQDPVAAMNWLPRELPPHCRVVFSAIDIPAALSGARQIAVKSFSVEEAGETLILWFGDAKRKLQDEQRAKLLETFRQTGLPLYLKLAFEEARLWRSFDPLEQCLLGDGLPGIIDRLFSRLSMDANHGPVFLGHALGYLTAARYGLTEDEMLAVLAANDDVWKDFERTKKHDLPQELLADAGKEKRRLPVILWSRLYFDLEPYLAERAVLGGTVMTFYHRQLWRAAEQAYIRTEGTRVAKHRELSALFRRDGDPQDDDSWSGTPRGLAELPFHLAAAGSQLDLERLLISIRYLDARCNIGDVYDLLNDFDRLAVPGDACGEMRDFIRSHAQSLEAKRDVLFGLIQHEGPTIVRESAEQLLRLGHWQKPWFRTTALWLPTIAADEGNPSIKVIAKLEFEPSAAVGLAGSIEMAFYLERLGCVRVVDAAEMRKLPQNIVLPSRRVLGLFPSADGRYLAAAFEDGGLSVLELGFSLDRVLMSQHECGSFQYLVPEFEPPKVYWHGHELLYQRTNGSLAIVNFSNQIKTDVHLPRGCEGELSNAVLSSYEWVATIRQSADTWIWRCGGTDTLRIEAADATCAACLEDGSIVVGLSDYTIRRFETHPRLDPTGTILKTEHIPVSAVAWNGQVMWCEPQGLHHWDPQRNAAARLLDNETLFHPSFAVYLRHVVSRGNQSLLAVSDSRVYKIGLADQHVAASYQIDETLVDNDRSVYAVQKRSEELWLVDCTSREETRFATQATVRYFYNVDGRGRLAALSVNGEGVMVDLRTHQTHRISGPVAVNSIAVHEGVFWLIDRHEWIYRMEHDKPPALVTKVKYEDRRGARLKACGDWLIWHGYNNALSKMNPYEDAQECLLLFRLLEGAPYLEAAGFRSFPKEDGVFQVVAGVGPQGELVAIFHGHSKFPLCAKIGTPDAFLRGEEKTMGLDFDAEVASCIVVPDEEALYLCSGDDLVVVDFHTLKTRCRLTSSSPFTSLAGDYGRGILAVAANKRLYHCRVEVPSHAHTV